ncbi:FtsX-like permease family protein [Arthrobacter woluwensis]|uniref:FtsX-like permease family protein n=1 Tax=Arthrobacter woluwensis TaxID=156980 RepID=UPI001AAE799D|nr:FtsX-like permease family protein [Arthrobacter woluwensis]QTF71916.1 MscL family protein [Arthrobacter woluwensis]
MNAVERFIRSRVLLLTATILIATMALSVLVQSSSQAALVKTVDQNSRGLYDILVQAPGQGEGKLMQPDIVTGQGGISFDQLDKIRQMDGTAVAAPISLVSRVTQNLEAPQLRAMDYLGYNSGLVGLQQTSTPGSTDGSKWPQAESVLPDKATKYRITASATSSDGVTERQLFSTVGEGTLGKAKVVQTTVAGGKSVQIQAPEGETGIKFPAPAGNSTHTLFNANIALPLAPEISESVVAVDPTAERALLGEAGAFLAPLEKAPPADGRNAGAIGRFFQEKLSSGMSQQDIQEGPDFLGVRLKYWAPTLMQYEASVRSKQITDDSQAIPLVVRQGTDLDVKYNVKIEELDDAGNVTKEVGTVSKNLGDGYLPFVSKSPFVLQWPGGTDHSDLLGSTSSFASGLYDPATWSTQFAAAPDYSAKSTEANGSEEKQAVPGDWVTVNSLPERALDGTAVDQGQRKPVQDRSYRKDVARGDAKATPLPIVYGTFDPSAVQKAAGDINRLPLGGYDPVPFSLAKDASGNDAGSKALKPSLSATGLVSQSAGAITDYYGLAAARGYTKDADVVDAIRVRAKAEGGWRQAGGDIAKLADQIRALGLKATIVSGSAREDANIFVPGYSKDASGAEQALGTVQQSWVRQDAAAAVSSSLSGTNIMLLFLALLGATLLTAASTVSYVRKRRADAGILRAMGWNQKQIRKWVLQEFGVGAAALAAAGLILSLLSWNLATAIVSLLVLVIYAVAAWLAVRQLRHHHVVDQEVVDDSSLITIDSPLTFANRQLKTHRFNTLALAVAVGVFGAAVGALVSVLVDIPRAAGASALGGLAAGSIVLPAIILAVAGAVVGLFLTIVTGRFELGAKREQIGVLNAMGWNPDMLRQVRFFEHALVGLYALPIGVLGAALLGIFLAPYAAVWAGIAGLLAVVVWVPVATRIIR